jgi:hypothetical protein
MIRRLQMLVIVWRRIWNCCFIWVRGTMTRARALDVPVTKTETMGTITYTQDTSIIGPIYMGRGLTEDLPSPMFNCRIEF